MKNYIFAILIILITSSCGFKVRNLNELSNYQISKISTSGDKLISYKIKNKLLLSSKNDQEKVLVVKLKTVKTKNIKEKNIKNEITKYSLTIEVNVKFHLINKNDEIIEFKKRRTGDFNVANKYSQTLNNEKKLVSLLIETISDQITEEFLIQVNDL